MKLIPTVELGELGQFGVAGVTAGRIACAARPRHAAGNGTAMPTGVPTVVRSGDESPR